MLMRKNWVDIFAVIAVVVANDLVLGFFIGSDSGGGCDIGLLIVGDDVISAVGGWRWCLMVIGALLCSV